MSSKVPASLWLIPERDAMGHFRGLIEQLCRDHQAPPFIPHITLYSWPETDPERINSRVAPLLEGVAPLRLKLTGTATSDDFFRCFVARVDPSEALLDLRRRIEGLEKDPRDRSYEPHLSLLYKSLPAVRRDSLPGRYPIGLRRAVFDSVWLATPGNQSEGWRDVASWRIRGRFALTE